MCYWDLKFCKERKECNKENCFRAMGCYDKTFDKHSENCSSFTKCEDYTAIGGDGNSCPERCRKSKNSN